MLLTKTKLANYIIEFYDNLNSHEDIKKIHINKLKIINKILKLNDDAIVINYKKKLIELNDESSEMINYQMHHLNELLKMHKRQKFIGNGNLTTSKLNEQVKKSYNYNKCFWIVSSHQEQIRKELHSAIADLIYSTFNLEVAYPVFEIDELVLKESIDYFDYI